MCSILAKPTDQVVKVGNKSCIVKSQFQVNTSSEMFYNKVRWVVQRSIKQIQHQTVTLIQLNVWHVFPCVRNWNISLCLYSFALSPSHPDHPERAALFFVSGVCLGLFLTLFALVVQISCRTDCRPRQRPPAKKRARPANSSSDSSDSDSDWDTTSDLSARRHRRFERTLNMNVFTSAEELERAQRLEERERIIREIWMNGQPDIPGTRSLNRYYWRAYLTWTKCKMHLGVKESETWLWWRFIRTSDSHW